MLWWTDVAKFHSFHLRVTLLSHTHVQTLRDGCKTSQSRRVHSLILSVDFDLRCPLTEEIRPTVDNATQQFSYLENVKIYGEDAMHITHVLHSCPRSSFQHIPHKHHALPPCCSWNNPSLLCQPYFWPSSNIYNFSYIRLFGVLLSLQWPMFREWECLFSVYVSCTNASCV
jgi:hypothetical protein